MSIEIEKRIVLDLVCDGCHHPLEGEEWGGNNPVEVRVVPCKNCLTKAARTAIGDYHLRDLVDGEEDDLCAALIEGLREMERLPTHDGLLEQIALWRDGLNRYLPLQHPMYAAIAGIAACMDVLLATNQQKAA